MTCTLVTICQVWQPFQLLALLTAAAAPVIIWIVNTELWVVEEGVLKEVQLAFHPALSLCMAQPEGSDQE